MYLPSWVPLHKIDDNHWERVWPLEFANDVDADSLERILDRVRTERFQPTAKFADSRQLSLRVLIVDRGEEHEYVLRLYHLFWKLRDAGGIKTINGVGAEAWAPHKILVWPALKSVPGGFERTWGVKFARSVSDAQLNTASQRLSTSDFRLTLEKTDEASATVKVVTGQQAWTDEYAILAIELFIGLEAIVAPLTWGGSGPQQP